MISTKAICRNGAFVPLLPIDVSEGSMVNTSVTPADHPVERTPNEAKAAAEEFLKFQKDRINAMTENDFEENRLFLEHLEAMRNHTRKSKSLAGEDV